MKIAVTGNGAGNLRNELLARGCVPLACDITDAEATEKEIKTVSPDVIIHCAAMTDVDACEEHPKTAFDVNVVGTSNVASVFDGEFIYISTDHVFSGKKYFLSSEKHSPSPVNAYGFTKWSGEIVANVGICKTYVVRTSKLFTREMLQYDLYNLQEYSDMTREYTGLIKRSFLWLPHFAEALMEYVKLGNKPDILNLAGTESMSYYRFWQKIAKKFSIPEDRITERKHKLKGVVDRPFRGGLNVSLAKKLGLPLYSADEGIHAMRYTEL